MSCPTPDKHKYRSQAEANRAQRARYAERGERARLYPYQCAQPGHWHLTHHTPERQRAIFDQQTGAAGLRPVSNMFESCNVRHVITDQPLWLGRDVCDAVSISKYRDALAQLDADERVSIVVDTPGGPQGMSAVTEAGLWSLLLISRSPKVQPFKRWLTHDVLPAIRKTGRYDTSIALPDRKTLAHWVVEAETRAELAESKVAELEPSATAWNELAEADGSYSVGEAAKVLRSSGVATGRQRLFGSIAELGWIFRDGHGTWRAYQPQIENGRLVEKVNRPYTNSLGVDVVPAPTIRITPKGLQALHAKLGGQRALAIV